MNNGKSAGFGVYIHWPYCAQKCPYCDFNSHVRMDGWDEERIGAAYERELGYVAGLTGKRRVDSIFFGGGTPSLMQPATVERIIERVGELWSLDSAAEITLEANPGSVEAGRFRGYRAAGVNRVSLGVQSLRDEELKALGRIHSVSEAKAAIELSSRIFERSSFDLIYARPKHRVEDWRVELQEGLNLAQGGHLSLYQLTIEPDTPFAKLHSIGKLVVPDADHARELYDVTQALTSGAGMPAYEISNHAVVGQESRHNLTYWRYGEYAGVGPGAHGRLVVEGQRYSTSTERHPETWVARVEEDGHGFIERTVLAHSEQADEMLLMGLRLREGLDLTALARVGGVRPSAKVIDELCEMGMIERMSGGQGLRAVGEGVIVLNEIVCRLSASFEPMSEVSV